MTKIPNQKPIVDEDDDEKPPTDPRGDDWEDQTGEPEDGSGDGPPAPPQPES